jgi:acyl-CoA dehydrogenase
MPETTKGSGPAADGSCVRNSETAWMPNLILEETVARLLADFASVDAVMAAEDRGFSTDLWEALARSGLALVSVPESAGGSGGSLGDALSMLRLAGRHAAPVPLAETAVLAGWLAASTGLSVPDDGRPLTLAPGDARDELSLQQRDGGWQARARLHRVPWGREAGSLALLAPTPHLDVPFHVAIVPLSACNIQPGRNLAGEPRDLVLVDAPLPADHVAPCPPDVDPDALRLRGALTRAVLMAGAFDRVVELTISYADARHQFGRSISSFQVVQHGLVQLASEAGAATIAVEVAAFSSAEVPAPFEVAVAKAVTSSSADVVSRIAHQVHGAIGMTREYELNLYTRRLWCWRQEFGSARWWNSWIGRRACAEGADRLWPRIATGLVASRGS